MRPCAQRSMNEFFWEEDGRSDRIRTCDPQSPRLMRYRAALRSDLAFVPEPFRSPAEEARIYKPNPVLAIALSQFF